MPIAENTPWVSHASRVNHVTPTATEPIETLSSSKAFPISSRGWKSGKYYTVCLNTIGNHLSSNGMADTPRISFLGPEPTGGFCVARALPFSGETSWGFVGEVKACKAWRHRRAAQVQWLTDFDGIDLDLLLDSALARLGPPHGSSRHPQPCPSASQLFLGRTEPC